MLTRTDGRYWLSVVVFLALGYWVATDGTWSMGGSGVAGVVAGVVAVYGWRRHRELNGLDQWPNPNGPLYDEWLSIPVSDDGLLEALGHGGLDYYPWLLRRFGDREPWRTWVRLEREIYERAERDDREYGE